MTRLLAAVAAGALALGLTATAGAPAQAGGLKSCGSYYKVKNIGCQKAAPVVEEGLARLLDENDTQIRFDGWTCKRKDLETDRFTCTRKANGTKQVVKYTS